MSGPISIVFSNIYIYIYIYIYICKMEFDVAVPTNPLFCKHYVDDTHVCRKKNARDILSDELNS